MAKILIIDDDVSIGNMIETALLKAGHEAWRAYSGTEALLLLEKEQPELILLDLMLPGLSGEELLPKIREIPVIVVSAKVGIDDKVNMLLGGAVDYLTKPFELKELLARIEVQLRKKESRREKENLTAGKLPMKLTSREVTLAGHPVHLTKTEYAVLKILLQNPGQAIAKSVLLDRISEDTLDCTEASLKMHISNLRKKLREIDGKDHIESVWGIGFRLL